MKVLTSMARYHLERGHAYCKGSCDRGGSINIAGTALIRVRDTNKRKCIA